MSSTGRLVPRERASSGEQTTTSSLCSIKRRLVGHQPVPLARGERGQQPVVGDVVEAGPSGADRQRGVRGVVDPEQRAVEPQLVDGIEHLALERPVGERAHQARAATCGAAGRGSGGGPRSSRGPVRSPRRPDLELVGDVDGGGDEEHLQRRVEVDELVDQDPDPPSDLAPGLERAHHQGHDLRTSVGCDDDAVDGVLRSHPCS